jgi:HPt (histidine-containing phosphotransfer) domain-containing protein
MYSTIIINWEQLSLVVGDDSMPGDDEMKELYRLFVEDAGQRLRALVAPDLPFERMRVAKEAHKIRGAASSFGFEQVAVLLRTVETQIGELPQDRIEQLLHEALACFEHSTREVQGRYPALA